MAPKAAGQCEMTAWEQSLLVTLKQRDMQEIRTIDRIFTTMNTVIGHLNPMKHL
jgi:hypothetical protein